METQTQNSQPVSRTDYASALKQYRKYSRGRIMHQFCEDEGYDYAKFCRYAREGEKEQAIDREPSTFLEISAGSDSAGHPCGPVHVKEVRIRFSNGMVLSRRGDDIDGILSLVYRDLVIMKHDSRFSTNLIPNSVRLWDGDSDYKAMKPYIDIAEKVKSEQMAIFEQSLKI